MPQYQGVWTLEQQAQAQSNQQWVTDPNFKNTTLLLQADGTGSGSQNQTFLDGSTNNFFITRNGNTTQGSFSPFSQAPGYWSNYFNGSSTISFGSNSALNILAYDTFECWVNMPVIGTNDLIAGKDGNYWMGYNFTGIGGTSNKFVFAIYNGSSWQSVSSTTTPVVGTWYHLLGVKDNTTMRFYVNGVQESTSTFSGSPVTTGTFYVASNNNVENFEGYISNLRLITGASNAVFPYSGLTTGGSFTPPTSALTAVTGTALLTCQSNRFVDNSSNNFSATITSIPSVQAFGPFAPALQWTPDVVGGSGYFDGSDYLNVSYTATNFGTADFTVEAWVYYTSRTDYNVLLDTRDSGTANPFVFGITSTNGYLYYYTGTEYASTTSIPLNSWNHVAVTRLGTTLKLFLNGTEVLSRTDSSNLTGTSTGSVVIGRAIGGTGQFNGYISGYRVLKGTGYSSITVPTAPPTAITNTSLLLNYTNAGIYDGKMGNVLETVGSAQVSTNPVKYGSGSMYFSGVSPYSYLKGNANLGQSVALAGDFTVECWVWLTADTSDNVIMDTRPGSNAGNYFLFYLWTSAGSTKPVVAWYTPAVGYIVNSGGAVPANAWTHIAVSRANGMMRSFINGVVQQTAANTTAYANPGAPYPYIGASYGAGSDSFKGYIDDFRITNGVARYIANFTPPQQALPRQ